ncbi:Hypothetical protein R9X50_00326700 [Acrodontium crateriforme]|uniref:Inheritance of peroxisomes protein 1 n=1 Tax=Acrodontium crateriforme TaxID=150365 RepID=A0AAQ3M395_9PEZI|nr:Hypothetical protein R9X50_00326700 [Acrodontium crateriforme]
MASSPIAPPPDVRRVAINRSFTLPSRLDTAREPTVEIGAAEGIETLFSIPNANVVKFSTAGVRSLPRDADSKDGPHGTLPWASPTERTMAAGPLEIYRVPGSVSFLHSGTLLHAILPRSQCWCVDGVSKFAFRVLQDVYYRIELPGHTEEDMAKVELLKETWKKVLYYERTPCPFSRTFTVEIPEETPKIRRSRRKTSGPAKKWKLARAYTWKPEDGEEPPRPPSSSADSVSGSGEETDESAREEGSWEGSEVAGSSESADDLGELPVSTPTKIRGLKGMRSLTAPPQLTLRSTPPSKMQTRVFPDRAAEDTTRVEREPPNPLDPARLETFQVIPTHMPPSPPDSSAGLEASEPSSRLETWVNQSAAIAIPAVKAAENVPDVQAGTTLNADDECTQVGIKISEPVPETKTLQITSNEVKLQQFPDLLPTRPSPRALVEQIASIERSASQDRSRPISSQSASSSSSSSRSTSKSAEDPFAAIQARILARRSIGGSTNAFHPSRPPPSASLSKTTSLSSTKSSLSLRSQGHHQQQHQAFSRALVSKACTTVFGPPANLVAIMLRIAARFAGGTFRNTLLVQSPPGKAKVVPGSFDLRSVDADDIDDADLRGEEWEEDDFGVPLSSPVRLTSGRERQRMGRTRGSGVD